MYKFKLIVGDASGNGHNISEIYLISCNKTKEQVEEAYTKSCEKTGLVFTENTNIIVNGEKINWQHPEYKDRRIAVEYQSSISLLALNILKYHISDLIIKSEGDWIGLCPYSLVDTFMKFIKISLTDLEYKIIEDETPILNIDIGYGLYS